MFTASVEATHRLFLLLDAFGGAAAAEFSSKLTTSERMSIVKEFNSGALNVLVSSDALARGIDLEGVDHVISYDTPVYPKTYVHRVGRTARAGRAGVAVTLLRPEEVRHFRQMRRKIDDRTIAATTVAADDFASLVPRYEAALGVLQQTLRTEARDNKRRKRTGDKATDVLLRQLRASLLA